ncbi:MAG TPA: hypothetical protein VKA89_08250 [Solirubrobacterales bacterium]|nr:hypothetical protein [Solirubrobacterales bacterium]
MIYALIGRAVVKLVRLYVVRFYGRQLKVGAGALVVFAAVAGYLLTRDVPEG